MSSERKWQTRCSTAILSHEDFSWSCALWLDSTEIIAGKPQVLKTQPARCLHGYSPTQKQLLLSHCREKRHFCQTTQIKMLIVKIKSLVVGLKVLPSWKIFPNGKCEPTDHRCWKTKWYTVNNDYLKLWLALLHWAVETRLLEACFYRQKGYIYPSAVTISFFRMKSSLLGSLLSKPTRSHVTLSLYQRPNGRRTLF